MNNPAKSTIGQAIDQAMAALSQLEKREQQVVISTLCSLLDLVPSAANLGGVQGSNSAPNPPTIQGSTGDSDSKPSAKGTAHAARGSNGEEQNLDIRTLRNRKQPASAQQMACVVAYYLQEHAPEEERTKEVTTADLERLFKQAGFKLPSRMQQVLIDAKSAGYFESIDRGKYKLTRVGYNLVTHSLPKASAT